MAGSVSRAACRNRACVYGVNGSGAARVEGQARPHPSLANPVGVHAKESVAFVFPSNGCLVQALTRYSMEEVVAAVASGPAFAAGGTGDVFRGFLRGHPVAIKRVSYVCMRQPHAGSWGF